MYRKFRKTQCNVQRKIHVYISILVRRMQVKTPSKKVQHTRTPALTQIRILKFNEVPYDIYRCVCSKAYSFCCSGCWARVQTTSAQLRWPTLIVPSLFIPSTPLLYPLWLYPPLMVFLLHWIPSIHTRVNLHRENHEPNSKLCGNYCNKKSWFWINFFFFIFFFLASFLFAETYCSKVSMT